MTEQSEYTTRVTYLITRTHTYEAHRDTGREYLAILYAGCSAEQYAIARALMRIEEE